jgi:hypothetical protein
MQTLLTVSLQPCLRTSCCTHTVLPPSSIMILTLVRVLAESLKMIGLKEKARAASVIAFTAVTAYHTDPFEHLSDLYACGLSAPHWKASPKVLNRVQMTMVPSRPQYMILM